jgi:hypothetical protein
MGRIFTAIRGATGAPGPGTATGEAVAGPSTPGPQGPGTAIGQAVGGLLGRATGGVGGIGAAVGGVAGAIGLLVGAGSAIGSAVGGAAARRRSRRPRPSRPGTGRPVAGGIGGSIAAAGAGIGAATRAAATAPAAIGRAVGAAARRAGPRAAGGPRSAAGARRGGRGAGVGRAVGRGVGAAAAAAGVGAVAGRAASGEGPAPGAEGGYGAPGAGPLRIPKIEPDQDPRFQAVTGAIGAKAGRARAHRPAKSEAGAAQAAAMGPANDTTSQAKAAQVGAMAEAKPGVFDRVAFIAAVKQAIERSAPHSLSEVTSFKSSGKVEAVKRDVKGLVGQNKDTSKEEIKGATEAPPDPSKAVPKEVTPLKPDGAPPAPGTLPTTGAVPEAQPAAATDLRAGPAEVNQSMAEEGVTEEQLKKSNEPEFEQAVDAKKEAEVHSATAPAAYRAEEAPILAGAKASAKGKTAAALTAMHGAKTRAIGGAGKDKTAAKAADEKRRAEVASDIEAKYAATKTETEAILANIDRQVEPIFESGEKGARERFESTVARDMSDYKSKRYSGARGKLRWLRDKFKGLPSAVNVFYTRARDQYVQDMDAVIGRIADVVGIGLTAARQRIAKGQADIAAYVAKLPKDLKKVGQDAQKNLEEKFDALTASVDDKQADLVSSLAEKYVAARDSLDERIQELQDENKGLIDKAKDAIKRVINTIRKLKDMLLNVLARAAGAIGSIIAHPIAFLQNLVGAVKAGVTRFKENIEKHLKAALTSWLFGELAETGITLPEKFDLRGVLSLVLQLLGLTYANIRSRVVRAVGEKVVSKIEKTAEVFRILVSEGPAGLWKFVQDKLEGLKKQAMDAIQGFLVEKIIVAGITWLISLLNPASAFIKACKAIYDIIMFLVDRASQIEAFVNTVLDSVEAIVSGAVGSIAEKIESVLAKALPLVIGMLASLLGLGGIGAKIREIIGKIQKPVNKLIDGVVMPIAKKAKSLYGKGAAFVKGKVEAGKKWAKGKVEAGKSYVKGRVAAGKALVGNVIRKIVSPFSMAGTSHQLIVSSEDNLLVMSSVPKAVVARLNEEKEHVTKKVADPAVRAAQLVAVEDMLEHAKQVASTAKTFGPKDPKVQSGVNIMRTLIADYADRYRRRGLGSFGWPKGAEEGSVTTYGRQGKGGSGKFIHEHVIPSSLFAAMAAMKRKDKGFRPVDRGLTTITWDTAVADVKTHGTASQLGGRVNDNVALSRAKQQMAAGNFDFSGFVEDRIQAAIAARNNIGLDKPTDSQIIQAGHLEMQSAWSLLSDAQGRS